MDIYIDSAMLCATVMNYLILDVSAAVMNIRIKKKVLAAGAFVLAMLGVLSVFGGMLQLLCFAGYIGVILLIFGRSTFAGYMRRFGICIGVTMVFSAVIFTFVPPDKLSRVLLGKRIIFCADDLYFYGLLAPAYAVVRAVIFFINKNKRIFRVVLNMGGETAEALGFLDTGNSLREPESGSAVIVAERCLFCKIPEYYKYIPCKTVSDSRSMIKVYPLDELYFPEEKISVKNIYVAFSDKPLCNGKYRVLLNNSFF